MIVVASLPTFAAADCPNEILQTLLAANDRLGLHDPLAATWRDTLAKLPPFPVDPATGYMIGAGVPFAKSHRHFSHLFMIYPLHLVDAESAADRPLIEKSLDHWQSLPEALRGYSYTGGSAMSAWLGRSDDAVRLLDRFLAHEGLGPGRAKTAWWVPLGPPPASLVRGRALFAGDAANLVMATNGGGIPTAMLSGWLAGTAAAPVWAASRWNIGQSACSPARAMVATSINMMPRVFIVRLPVQEVRRGL